MRKTIFFGGGAVYKDLSTNREGSMMKIFWISCNFDPVAPSDNKCQIPKIKNCCSKLRVGQSIKPRRSQTWPAFQDLMKDCYWLLSDTSNNTPKESIRLHQNQGKYSKSMGSRGKVEGAPHHPLSWTNSMECVAYPLLFISPPPQFWELGSTKGYTFFWGRLCVPVHEGPAKPMSHSVGASVWVVVVGSGVGAGGAAIAPVPIKLLPRNKTEKWSIGWSRFYTQ